MSCEPNSAPNESTLANWSFLARAKLAAVRAGRDEAVGRRERLAARVRSRRVGIDLDAAEAVRATGWARR